MADDASLPLAGIPHADLVRMLERICEQNHTFRAALQSEIDAHRIMRAGGVDAILIEDTDSDESGTATSSSNQIAAHKRKHSESASGTAQAPKKVKAKRTADLCSRCGLMFYDDEEDVVCVYHGDKDYYHGTLEQYDGEDFWDDHDEDRFGAINDDSCKMEYPEGFRWDCCNQAGNVKGCSTATSHTNGTRGEQARLVINGFRLTEPNAS